MWRATRLDYSKFVYHIINRGHARQAIFADICSQSKQLRIMLGAVQAEYRTKRKSFYESMRK